MFMYESYYIWESLQITRINVTELGWDRVFQMLNYMTFCDLLIMIVTMITTYLDIYIPYVICMICVKPT